MSRAPKTHKVCKSCGIKKPVYRFKNGNICFSCQQKKSIAALEKDFRKVKTTPPECEANAVCLHCQKPLGNDRDGTYHKSLGCRVKRREQANRMNKTPMM